MSGLVDIGMEEPHSWSFLKAWNATLSEQRSLVRMGGQVVPKMYNYLRKDETSGFSKGEYPYFEPNWHSCSNIIQIQVKSVIRLDGT